MIFFLSLNPFRFHHTIWKINYKNVSHNAEKVTYALWFFSPKDDQTEFVTYQL